MSAAERARLSRSARALLGPEASACGARTVCLRRADPRPALGLGDLDEVPTWLPPEPVARARFVHAAGLAAMASGLQQVIDGTALRRIADQAGPDLVDWALKLGTRADLPTSQIPVDADVSAIGSAVLSAVLPGQLAPWFASSLSVNSEAALWAVERAREISA